MTQITVSEFRRDMKRYAELVKTEDIIVVSHGTPVMRISDPFKDRVLAVKQLRGSVHTDTDYDAVMEERLKEL